MKTKDRKKPPQKSRQPRAKQKARKAFYAKLQKALHEVDWEKAELPRVWW